MNDSYSQIISSQGAAMESLIKSYLCKVYAWMGVSMALTAGAAVYAMSSLETLEWSLENMWLFIIGSFVVIGIMSFARGILSGTMTGLLFLVFSVLEGLSLAPLLVQYTMHSVGITFACTAGMFFGMTLYGLGTKRNLSGMGRFLMMALIGLIIATFIHIFWGTETSDLVISCCGVVVFSLFTAYDTQKIARQGLELEGEWRAKGAVYGALNLYLDFVNIFLYLLRFLGDRD